jgi:hypothetical protein
MPRAETPSHLTTTLYNLITALQDVVAPDDDTLVVAMVVHLLRSGRLLWDETDSVRRRPARRREDMQ